jgi:beta-phosphoglucomutase
MAYNQGITAGRLNPMVKEAILFDMDGVILDSMPYHFKAWQEAFATVGIQVDQKEIYLREGEKGEVTAQEIWDKSGKDSSPAKVKQLLKLKESIFQRICHPRVFEGVEELLLELKKRHFLLGLITGTSRGEVERILPSDLLGLFDTIITGDQVERGKPFPDPYLLAIKTLRIEPRSCLVIENSPNGILSAKQAGLQCLALTTSLPKEYLQEADQIVNSWAQLKDILLDNRF